MQIRPGINSKALLTNPFWYFLIFVKISDFWKYAKKIRLKKWCRFVQELIQKLFWRTHLDTFCFSLNFVFFDINVLHDIDIHFFERVTFLTQKQNRHRHIYIYIYIYIYHDPKFKPILISCIILRGRRIHIWSRIFLKLWGWVALALFSIFFEFFLPWPVNSTTVDK